MLIFTENKNDNVNPIAENTYNNLPQNAPKPTSMNGICAMIVRTTASKPLLVLAAKQTPWCTQKLLTEFWKFLRQLWLEWSPSRKYFMNLFYNIQKYVENKQPLRQMLQTQTCNYLNPNQQPKLRNWIFSSSSTGHK